MFSTEVLKEITYDQEHYLSIGDVSKRERQREAERETERGRERDRERQRERERFRLHFNRVLCWCMILPVKVLLIWLSSYDKR